MKKKKQLSDNLSKRILEVMQMQPNQAFNYKQLSKLLDSDEEERKKINKILLALAKEKYITEIHKGKYKIVAEKLAIKQKPKKYITGTVDMKSTGKAYIISPEAEEDILIMPNNTKHALHGDLVKVFVFPKRKGRKTEGEIVEVLDRAKKSFVGVVQMSKNFAFLIPDNAAIHVDLFIPLENLNGAKDGDKAIAEIVEWPERSKNPFGKIVHVLGKPGSNEVEINSILAEFEFPLFFPKEVEQEANQIPLEIPKHEISKRKDFRAIPTFTIDPIDAKDFDDALSIKKLENGNWEVGIHIADVSYYVQPNTLLDKEAYNRGTSVYLVDRVIPMLPEHLSNGVCSLREKEDKLCFSVVVEMSDDGEIHKKWIGKTIICSDKRFNYDEVQEIIENKQGIYCEEILQLHHLAQQLRNKRFVAGSLAFEKEEVKFILNEAGKPIDVFFKEYKDSNKLVEDFMLLANRIVAEYIGKKKPGAPEKTFVYRIHDEPNPEKLNIFSEFVAKLGYKVKTNSRKNIANSFNKLLEDVAGKGEQNMIETLAIRTMAKAYYSTDNIGHYGLAFDYYTHFTSPIRRYPDLMVHRLLEKYLKGGASENKEVYESMCKHASDMEKRASEAERASVKLKQVEFLADKIGQVFDAQITGVSKWGIFAEIIENKCEGLIRMQDLEDDFYYLDEENFCVIGQKNKFVYKLGDKIKISVQGVNLSRKQLDYAMVSKPM